MKPLIVSGGVAIGLALPFLAFGAIILTLAAVDVEAQRLGVGTD